MISIAIAIVGLAILSGRDLPTPGIGELAVQILRNAELAALLGAFGLAIGSLIRNQPTAIVGVLVLSFVIEPTILALVPEVGRFGPFSGLSASVQAIPSENVGVDNVDLLSPGLAALAMLVWIAVPFAAGVALLRRRDLN
jgi:ABC-type transport system involved in multi-copper enzyme maturation permease subunit